MPRPAHIERQKVISWTPLVVDGGWQRMQCRTYRTDVAHVADVADVAKQSFYILSIYSLLHGLTSSTARADFGSWPSGKRDRLLTHAHQDHCQG